MDYVPTMSHLISFAADRYENTKIKLWLASKGFDIDWISNADFRAKYMSYCFTRDKLKDIKLLCEMERINTKTDLITFNKMITFPKKIYCPLQNKKPVFYFSNKRSLAYIQKFISSNK